MTDEYADGVLRGLLSDSESGGLSEQELAGAVYELHTHYGLSFGEIATCLPRDIMQVRDLYAEGQEVLADVE